MPPVCRVERVEDAGDVLVFSGLGDGFLVAVVSACRVTFDEAEDAAVLFPAV